MNHDKMISESLAKFEAEDKSFLKDGLATLNQCLKDLHEPSVVCLKTSVNCIDTVIKYSGFATGFPGERINGNVLSVSMELLIAFSKKEEGNIDYLKKAIQQGRYKEYEKQIIKNILRDYD